MKQQGMNSEFDAFPVDEVPLNDVDLLPELDVGDDADSWSTPYADLPLQDVEVHTDKAEGRLRQISARIQIPYAAEQVWQILTDYDRLAEFVPNLTRSQRIVHPEGGIRIEQIGAESLMKLKFCARVVLDMVEQFPHRIDFTMVEGDFKQFQGSWILEPVTDGTATNLEYQLLVLPPRIMPVALIERRLKGGMILNLSAIRQRADDLFGLHPQSPGY
jgi:ribosome-associated toxin RatA of RatAB toxin-antitoxin module